MGSGTHTTTATTYWDSDISLAVEHPRFTDEISVDVRILETYLACYKGQKRSLPVRAINKLRECPVYTCYTSFLQRIQAKAR